MPWATGRGILHAAVATRAKNGLRPALGRGRPTPRVPRRWAQPFTPSLDIHVFRLPITILSDSRWFGTHPLNGRPCRLPVSVQPNLPWCQLLAARLPNQLLHIPPPKNDVFLSGAGFRLLRTNDEYLAP